MIITLTLNPGLDRTLTVPRILPDEVLRATKTQLDWGGKGFNVSRALMALGMDSLAMGLVGGTTGRMLERGLGDLGIATDLLQIAGETRTNIIVIDAFAERHIKVNEPGPAVQQAELAALLDRVRERVRPRDLWVLSGSLPPGVSPAIYAQLIDIIHAGGAKAFLDTSGDPLRLGCAAHPFLVKPNVSETEEMMGRAIDSDTDALQAAAFFLEQGIDLVALSLGAGGLLLSSGQEAVRAIPPQVQVWNSVGAGDALLAGITWALERGLPLQDAARWGVAAGTAAAMGEGVGVGSYAEVQGLYEGTRTQSRIGPSTVT